MLGVFVLLVCLFVIGFFIRLSIKSRVIRKRIPLNVNDKYWLNENIPFYRSLNSTERIIFEDRVALFISNTTITAVDSEITSKSDSFFVAAAAVITFWGLPFWNYGELNEVLVYPENFDFDNTISPKGNVLGKVHHGGLLNNTMILSRRALINGFRNSADGSNVGIHEFTHLLDKEDGHIDGLPVGLNKEERLNWLKIFEKTLHSDKFALGNYARTNNAEFFAVSVEMYKETPKKLQKWHPELFQILGEYYSKQD